MTSSMKFLYVAIAIVCVACAATVAIVSNNSKTVAYVRAGKLFEDFQLTKELKNEVTRVQLERQNILDSLAMSIRANSSVPANANVQELIRLYEFRKQAFETQNREMVATYDQRVWTRIDQYAKEYCQREGIDILLGINESGSVLYGSPEIEVTEAVLSYCNTSYRGDK